MNELLQIPGIGKSIAQDLHELGIDLVEGLIGRNPEELYEQHNRRVGRTEDRCLLYAFRCAVYYADTTPSKRDPEKLKWWNWKDTIKEIK